MPLPLNEELSKLNISWKEELFQTKDLDNALDLYEITEDGKLKHLEQKRSWKDDPDSIIGGHLGVDSEEWVEVPFHGIVRFYTSYCDNESFDNELLNQSKTLSWGEIFKVEGYDWWIEFLAIFDNGQAREIRIESVDKTPISARLASNKEWSIKRQVEAEKFFNKAVASLRKIPGYKKFTHSLYRIEQKCHEKVSLLIRKIS